MTRRSAREGFFAAVRTWLEAAAQGEPFVARRGRTSYWAHEGMLDLIEYLHSGR